MLRLLKFIFKTLLSFLTKGWILFLGFIAFIIWQWYQYGGVGGAVLIGLFFLILILGFWIKSNSKTEYKNETYIHHDQERIRDIQSNLPTSIISKSNGKISEHIIISKHKRLPEKITYE